MIILHTYSERRPQQQVETLFATDKIREHYDVQSRLTTWQDDLSYWKVLQEYWGKDTLIHYQQDVVPTVAMVDDLWSCKQPACTYPHKLRSGWGLWRPASYDPIMGMEWYEPPFQLFVPGSGIALIKLEERMQRAIPLANLRPAWQHWSMVDYGISRCMMELEILWHVHTPAVPHNHF